MEGNTGIRINGREQALEILKMLTPQERERIIRTINLKNPSLAKDLKQNSHSTRDLESYQPIDFHQIFPNVKPEILGLALKRTSRDFQRSVLREAPRDYAEVAFKMLMTTLPESKNETVSRAKKLLITQLSQ